MILISILVSNNGLFNLNLLFIGIIVVFCFSFIIIETKQILDYYSGKSTKNLSFFNLYFNFNKNEVNNPLKTHIHKSLEIIEDILEKEIK